ncbi:MAG TPA: hypothetical protein VN612_10485 [Acidobacteriaceae bacterium]|nr:hypothetical protein [Acidobacteriaceae bacterium]
MDNNVKRYRVSYMNGVIEEDGSPRSPHDSEPMVLASAFEAIERRCEELERALRKIHCEAADEGANAIDSCNRICDIVDVLLGATP